MTSLRLAAATDLELVLNITNEAYAPWVVILGDLPLPMTEDYSPRVVRQEVWITERNGEAVGVLVLEPADDHLAIFSLAVLPAHQGQSIGRWMLDAAERMARSINLPELRLYTNARMDRNIKLYQQAGFHEIRRRPNPQRSGWTLVDMTKVLT